MAGARFCWQCGQAFATEATPCLDSPANEQAQTMVLSAYQQGEAPVYIDSYQTGSQPAPQADQLSGLAVVAIILNAIALAFFIFFVQPMGLFGFLVLPISFVFALIGMVLGIIAIIKGASPLSWAALALSLVILVGSALFAFYLYNLIVASMSGFFELGTSALETINKLLEFDPSQLIPNFGLDFFR